MAQGASIRERYLRSQCAPRGGACQDSDVSRGQARNGLAMEMVAGRHLYLGAVFGALTRSTSLDLVHWYGPS